MKCKLVLLLPGLLLLGSGLSHATPLGTAFTYQGRLDENGQPANGDYQMLCRLYDAQFGSSYLFITPTNVVSAANGLFTVGLDFGPLAFNGQERWLEISVRTNAVPPAGFITLPRTRIAPAPSAIYASTAGSVTTGAIQADQLSAVGTLADGKVLGYNGTSLIWRDLSGPGVWGTSGNHTYYTVGNVGIGTTSPSYPLQVVGGARIDQLEIAQNLRVLGGVLSTPNAEFIVEEKFSPLGPRAPRFIVKDNGLVGIGTSGPEAQLDVRGGNWNGEHGSLTLSANHPSIRFTGDGGSANQSWLIHLGGTPGNLEFYRRTGPGTWANALELDGAFARVPGAGGEEAYIGGDGQGGEVHVGSMNPAVTKVAFYNQTSGAYMHAVVCALTIMGGCDLAEPFPMKEDTIEKGSVVVIDHEHPGRLRRSTHAYDKRVAGIVSGANGINPGIALKQEGVMDQGENVALTGRVYVKADASSNAIDPGDLLTTSDTPGHAMKVADHGRAQGAILGKAMGALKGGTGLVLVLVTLQ